MPARLGRTRAARVVRQLSPRDRCGACGRVPVRRRGLVEGEAPLPLVEWHQGESGAVRASGLGWCGDAWGCADCWTPAAMHYAAVVTEAVAGWQPLGRSALMFTLTIPHRLEDDASAVWDALGGAWRWLVKHDDWRRFRARWQVAEWCATTEPNYSDTTGHHPHDHGLLFRAGPELELEELDALEAQLAGLWAVALRAVGWPRKLSLTHGVSVVPVEQIADVGRYLFKHVGLEFASPAATKAGRAAGSVPLRDVPTWLADVASRRPVRELMAEDAQVRRRAEAWLDYRAAASGRRAFRHSRGFYALTGTRPMGIAEIRRRTHKLRLEDRQRVEAAFVAAGLPPPDEDDWDGDAPKAGDADRPPVLAMTWEAFTEGQAAVEAPAERGSGAPVVEVLRAARTGPAFHALVCHLVEVYGAVRAAHLLASAMGRPPAVWRDARGTIVLAYRPEADDWDPADLE